MAASANERCSLQRRATRDPAGQGRPGLTPRRSKSGEQDIICQITKAGNAALRTALYQAANPVLCRIASSWLKAWAFRVAARRGKKRATVALARRIGVVLHRMWRAGTEFRFTREEVITPRAA